MAKFLLDSYGCQAKESETVDRLQAAAWAKEDEVNQCVFSYFPFLFIFIIRPINWSFSLITCVYFDVILWSFVSFTDTVLPTVVAVTIHIQSLLSPKTCMHVSMSTLLLFLPLAVYCTSDYILSSHPRIGVEKGERENPVSTRRHWEPTKVINNPCSFVSSFFLSLSLSLFLFFSTSYLHLFFLTVCLCFFN